MKRGNSRKILLALILVLMMILCLVWGIYNYCMYDDFFKANAGTIVSIVIAVLVSFYLVQRKNDLIRRKEKIDKLIYKIQEMVLNDTFGSVDDENIIRKNLIMQRSIGNKFKIIEGKLNAGGNEELEKAIEKFNEFKEFYGDHYKNKEYMRESVKDIANYKALIDDSCDAIHIRLYIGEQIGLLE